MVENKSNSFKMIPFIDKKEKNVFEDFELKDTKRKSQNNKLNSNVNIDIDTNKEEFNNIQTDNYPYKDNNNNKINENKTQHNKLNNDSINNNNFNANNNMFLDILENIGIKLQNFDNNRNFENNENNISIETPGQISINIPTESFLEYHLTDVSNNSFIHENLDKHIVKLLILRQNIINTKIGTYAWKKYINSIIWNYITTFINFSITLLTALCTGQAASSNILTQQQNIIILFVTFVLSTTNSFFKLNEKMNLSFKSVQVYYSFGAIFEKIYYRPVNNFDDVIDKINNYESLHDEINKYIINESIDNQNYFSEIIYSCVINNLLYRHLNNDKYSMWIKNDNRHDDLDGTFNNKKKKLKDLIADKIGNLQFDFSLQNSNKLNT